MALVDEIRAKISRNEFEYSQHALDQSIVRLISVKELREAVTTSELIEDYPDDKYGPSCLLLGHTEAGRPLHVQCSYPTRPQVKVITVYEPDPSRWVDLRVRRSE